MKAVSPVVEGLERHESFKGGPRVGQPQYLELPCLLTQDGGVVSRWEPTPEEREWIAKGADIYLTIWSGDAPYPPTQIQVMDKRAAWMNPEKVGDPLAEAERADQAAKHFNVVPLAEIPGAESMLRNKQADTPQETR